jgi:hypothetical protein
MISINPNILVSPNCWASTNPHPFFFTTEMLVELLWKEPALNLS